MPPQVRRSWRKKIRQIVTTKIMQKNMVKNWTVALKLKLKLHLWSTLCLVKSLWFNKKKLTKNTFWFHGNFFYSTKIYRTKSCRKKIHNTLPLPYYFFISTHFFLLLLSSWTNFCSFNFSFLLSCVNWIPLLINTGDGCTGSQLILTPEVHATPPSSLSMKRDYRKLELWKFSPTVHLFQSLSTIILNVSCCVLKIQILF